jgi:hypothetical protein
VVSDGDEPVFLSNQAWAIRASVDIRGVRPTVSELERATTADRAGLEELVNEFLLDPRFGQNYSMKFLDIFRTRHEIHFADLSYYQGFFSKAQLSEAVGSEPLRMLGYLADHDIPYTDFVTADWTVANEVLGNIYPLDYPEGETGWKRVQYTDGRPVAGVLSSNSLWWHYGSMLNNLNRGRANAVARIFLCDDYFKRDVDFSNQVLNSEEALGEAIDNDPACQSCHYTLDPLASHFYGFWWYGSKKGVPSEIETYHPERENTWVDLGGQPPGYFGEPTSGLGQLGFHVADDPRYTRCLVDTTYELMLRRLIRPEDHQVLNEHREVFEAEGTNIRELVRRIVLSDEYAVGAGAEALKMVTPAVLSSQVTDLTGFVWADDDWDLITAPNTGFMILAGGVDGVQVTRSAVEPGITQLLVQQRLAEGAAQVVVAEDHADPLNARLLTKITWDETQDDLDALIPQMQQLHARILSRTVEADSAEIERLLVLWRDLYSLRRDADEAWTGVVSVLLRDPEFLMY